MNKDFELHPFLGQSRKAVDVYHPGRDYYKIIP